MELEPKTHQQDNKKKIQNIGIQTEYSTDVKESLMQLLDSENQKLLKSRSANQELLAVSNEIISEVKIY
jgi:hypothetical protein